MDLGWVVTQMHGRGTAVALHTAVSAATRAAARRAGQQHAPFDSPPSRKVRTRFKCRVGRCGACILQLLDLSEYQNDKSYIVLIKIMVSDKKGIDALKASS